MNKITPFPICILRGRNDDDDLICVERERECSGRGLNVNRIFFVSSVDLEEEIKRVRTRSLQRARRVSRYKIDALESEK